MIADGAFPPTLQCVHLHTLHRKYAVCSNAEFNASDAACAILRSSLLRISERALLTLPLLLQGSLCLDRGYDLRHAGPRASYSSAGE
jgi:hypothetical protein